MEIVLYYFLTIIAGFAVQFLLCRKIQNTKLKYVPTYLVVIGWVFILVSFLGIFGNMGDSFFGHQFIALVLAVYFLPLTVGIIFADIFNLLQKKKKHKENNS